VRSVNKKVVDWLALLILGAIGVLVGKFVGRGFVPLTEDARILTYFPPFIGGLSFLLLAPAVTSFFEKLSRRAVLKSVAESLTTTSKNWSNRISYERLNEQSDQDWYNSAYREERIRSLRSFERALKEGVQTRSLKEKEEQLDRVVEIGLEYLVCVWRQEVEAIGEAARESLYASAPDGRPEKEEQLERLRELSSSIIRELDSTKPTQGAFPQSPGSVLERVRKPLAEMVMTAGNLGLLTEYSGPQPSAIQRDEAALFKLARKLDVTRRYETAFSSEF
jgi:hypothetical protein